MFKNSGEKLVMGLVGLLLSLVAIAFIYLICVVFTVKFLVYLSGAIVVAYAIGSLLFRLGFRVNR